MFGREREEIKLLREILKFLHETFPSKLTINFVIGDNIVSNSVVLDLSPRTVAPATATEIYKGQVYNPVPSDLTWSVQDGTVVSIAANPDGSATVTPLKVGSTQVGCSDKTTGLSGTGSVQVIAGADGLTINFGTPTNG